MECLPLQNMSDVLIFCSVGHASSKAILDTLLRMKIKSRETPKQGIIVVMSTTNQGICSHKSCIMYEIASDVLNIQDLNKTCLTGVPEYALRKTNQCQTIHQGS